MVENITQSVFEDNTLLTEEELKGMLACFNARIKDYENGVGFEKDRLEEIQRKLHQDTAQVLKSGSHIGLANVHTRIKLRGQNERHGVAISSSPDVGTTIKVLMPANWEGGK